ncbi:MAG: hypothetical protein H6851_02085 [Geminicoccaceae bacterium]|nr:hypothetical protein [Geminicoccaceae bacterium]MCB9942402.1 hypothetical protein [Geminicoccaceae bacterium]
MPIKPQLRWFYPIDWPQISRQIRFGRAQGRCEQCGRPDKRAIRQLVDGRWYDESGGLWRDDAGKAANWPDVVEYSTVRIRHVRLATAHLDHDPGNSRHENLRALCQRCHLHHDREEHVRRRRVTVLMRRALGDLFHGPYRHG